MERFFADPLLGAAAPMTSGVDNAFTACPVSPEVIIATSTLCGFAYTLYSYYVTSQAPFQVGKREDSDKEMPLAAEGGADVKLINSRLLKYAGLITRGALSFLYYEYICIIIFALLFSLVAGSALGYLTTTERGILTVIAYILGTSTSLLSGWIGMRIAVYANSRVALKCYDKLSAGFSLALSAGAVMGFSIMTLALFSLTSLIILYGVYFESSMTPGQQTITKKMFECIAGFGLGASTVAMFGRVGGGIFTKAADVGADIAGKLENDWDEDDPRNPAVIADNVGDNVGDIAGMGSDLFGSFAGSICAALVCCAQSPDLSKHSDYMMFPLVLAALGLIACIFSCLINIFCFSVKKDGDVELLLKRQLTLATIFCTLLVPTCYYFLPATFAVRGKEGVTWYHIAICCVNGLWSGLFIGMIAEYFTSGTYTPVKRLAVECKTSAATNIIQGLALGYKSCVIPITLVAGIVYINFSLARFLGISVGAIGILMTLASSLTIDAFGPITDNAGGLAEMCLMPEVVRERTDILDAAGNTTAAVGKGFAISSAMLVALGSFGAYAQTKQLIDAPMIGAFQFMGLIFGAVVPYYFFALTMESVGVAAGQMVEEVRRQLDEKHAAGVNGAPDASQDDCDSCIAIATNASLYEMIAPGSLIVLSPLMVGYLFGAEMLASFLLGAVVCSATMAVSASNTGGAWDNTKKFVKSGGLKEMLGENYDVKLHGKKSETHKNAIVGDTVGDPLKDTSGPALNIVMKLMAMVALVFAKSIPDEGVIQLLVRRMS
ncbi:hypothetical protein AAMO2058_000229100 [Amorphochlora amoebiformis]|uniref:H(+)-exporting diphosphatase n=1 Tax=Amorphochlora amoebiformis TaxID=1561963 RepID=A0A7S0DMP0_9EUKA|mmetsp:Transcript_33538/g.53962  ORF Transcript_33538/g.53962 Transcript_33538/m.53962 type:complete len:777 (+) Transcript_33538:55-2385(+)